MTEPTTAALPDPWADFQKALTLAEREHEPLVWGPASEGERTSSGRMLPAGWVWTCTCHQGGEGFPTEDDAANEATLHVKAQALVDWVRDAN